MKDYTKLLKKYAQGEGVVVHHEWGQSAVSLHNVVVRAWNGIDAGKKVGIVSAKHLGIKKAVALLNAQGFSCSITGKGEGDIRFAECRKDDDAEKKEMIPERRVVFTFREKRYEVNTGESIFSREGLDAGTRFLLEFLWEKEADWNGKCVADFGSGWGALSIVLACEFPRSTIVAYERDMMSCEAAKENAQGYTNITVEKADITDLESAVFLEKKTYFDGIVSNPPFHSTTREKALFFENACALLKQDGDLFFVIEDKFISRFQSAAQRFFSLKEEKKKSFYSVFWYKKRYNF